MAALVSEVHARWQYVNHLLHLAGSTGTRGLEEYLTKLRIDVRVSHSDEDSGGSGGGGG